MKKMYVSLIIISIILVGTWYSRKAFYRPGKPTLSNLNAITLYRAAQSQSTICSVQEAVNSMQLGSFSPCLLSLSEKNYLAHPGIYVSPHEKTIVITSRGYAYATQPKSQSAAASIVQFPRVGGGLICATNWIKYLKITCPVICFDYQDDWHHFDFGLSHDSDCLELVINEVIQQNPTCSIILIGTCKGSRSILHYLMRKNPIKNIKAAILDAPFASVEDLCKAAHDNFFKWMPHGHAIAYQLLRWWFPGYNPEEDLKAHVNKLPKEMPILIGHLKNDLLAQDQQIKDFVAQLACCLNHVHVSVVSHPSITHSKLSHIPIFQQVSNAFLAHYGMPHDFELAAKGSVLFPITTYNARNPKSWITCAQHHQN